MATAWFLAPYQRRPGGGPPMRYCAVDDLTLAIRADGGDWSEIEVLGQQAIVKVRASAATLALVAALPGVTRLPVDLLDEPLSALTVPQRNALRNRIAALGYTMAELDDALPGDIRTRTLREVLRFVARRRRKVRYDRATDSIVDDGPDVHLPARMLDDVDARVA